MPIHLHIVRGRPCAVSVELSNCRKTKWPINPKILAFPPYTKKILLTTASLRDIKGILNKEMKVSSSWIGELIYRSSAILVLIPTVYFILFLLENDKLILKFM